MLRATERSAGAATAGWQEGAKRLLDVAGSAAALLVLLPVFPVIMLLIRLDSRGPAIFRQERVGKDGKLFTCLKFRTMQHNADQEFHRAAIQRLLAGERLSDDPAAEFKLAKDPRVTRVGAILRRTSLDELPQLINVLRGDMSLVGPRPAIPYELETYQDWHHQRHLVKPGITGLWQVEGRGALSFNDMLRLDVEYATTWNVLTDIRLLVQTIPAVVLQRGAR